MDIINGLYLDVKTASKREMALSVDDQGMVSVPTTQRKIDFRQLEISPRIKDSTRFITFPGGVLFETEDNDQVDRLVAQFPAQSKAFSIEPSLMLRLAILVLVLLLSWAGIRYGIPKVSYETAMLVSPETLVHQGKAAFEGFDEDYFEESTLSKERQDELQSLFNELVPDEGGMYDFRLHLRSSKMLGANAFAMPSGDIVLTDELVKLAENDHEIRSVLLHEIAHVELRHGTQSLIQTSALVLAVVVFTGDITSVNALLLATPALLLNSGYSRRFEEEADQFSLDHMRLMDIDPIHFATMMEKLKEAHGESEEEHSKYWSSHPSSDDRIEKFEKASAEFNG
ncbi:M48 family metallopeptidase [Litoribrevibacter euphylliae]|uniref:M48 family metallopeptidase n=1 Tax=Litoribrevibacter euphylliae TaxID=1834034 RepID=A0ABV7HNE8_9GAMM